MLRPAICLISAISLGVLQTGLFPTPCGAQSEDPPSASISNSDLTTRWSDALPPLQPHRSGDFASVRQLRQRGPVLVVTYPWSLHEKASIEVRRVLDEETSALNVRPLFFRDAFFTGEMLEALFKTELASMDTRTVTEYQRDAFTFRLIGERNALGRPAVVAVTRQTIEPSSDLRVERAAFPLLDNWSISPRELHLELPQDYFGQSGRLCVWFLRGKDIVWTEVVQWPGFESP